MGEGGPSLTLKAEKIYFKSECAVAILKSITIVVTKQGRPFHNLTDFSNLGIEIKNYRLLVVKSGYLSQELQSLSTQSFMILTDDAVCQYIENLENKNRQQPIFPFQKLNEFVPIVRN